MSQRKFSRARWDPRRPRYLANPLWPLEELRDLRDPPFVADPEFTSFNIDALGCDSQNSTVLCADVRQFRSPENSHFHGFRREFPIPQLVTGLPWRFTQQTERPVVPEREFAPLDLSYISRQFIR